MNCDGNTLRQADFILNACGRPIPPKNTTWVDMTAHIGYSRFLPGDGSSAGTEDIGAVMHKGNIPFMLRSVTAQALPRATQGAYWRLRLPNGQYLQNELTSHAMAFGFGSDRQSLTPEIQWNPGEKLYVDLDTILAGPPPVGGYSVSMLFEGVYRFPITGSGAVSNPLNFDLPRYFNTPNQNILAPESYFAPGCPSETPAGFWDEEFCYVTPTAPLATNGAQVSNVALQIEPNSDFIVRSIWPYSPAATGFGSVVVRMRRGDGYALSSNFLPINSIQGPIFPELKVKARDNFYWDGYVVDGGGGAGTTITFGLYLYGVKRRRVIG